MSRPLSQRLSPTNVEKYKISIKTLADEVNSQFDLKGETLTPKQNGNTTLIPQLALPKKEKRKSIGEAYTEDVTEYRKQLLYYIKQTRKQYVPPKLIRSTPSSPVDIARPEGNNVTELLHYACAAGDETLLVELLQKEAAQREKMDVNTSFLDKATNHCTLLHKAARYDQVGIMKILFDFGALVEILDSLESTPLFYTAAGNAVQACEYLLAKHAQVNIRNQFEQSPLLVALKNGNFEIANALLLAKADIHFKGTSGQTCLHLACEEGSIEKVKFLLAQGASITRTNRDDETCLFSAIQHPPIVYAICDHVKTTQNENRLIALVRVRNNRGMTVLCRAAVEGYLDTFLVLINRIPANTKSSPNLLTDLINERSKQHNQTMLHLAVHYNRHEIVRLLMVSTETDFSKVMANGDTVLHYAIREKKDEDMIVMLIRADPVCTKIRNHERDTPKMIAKKMGLEEKYEDWFRMASIGSSDIVTIKSDKNVIPIRAITPRTPRSSAFDSPKTVSPKKAEQRKSIKNYFARRKTLALERVDVEKPRASESRPAVARKRSAFRFEDTLLESLKIPSEQITVTVESEPEKKPSTMSISEPDQDTDYLKVKRISNELGTVFAQDESNVYRIGFLVGSLMEISTRLFEKELQIMDYDTSRVSEQHRNFTEKIFDFHSLCLADLATRQVKNEFAKFLKGWVDTHEPVQQEIKRRSSMRLGLDTITDTGTSYDEDSIVESHD